MKDPHPHFYALPNEIYDALYSSKQKYPDSKLREYAIKRGLVLSQELDRNELCLRIASLPFSYEDYSQLSNSLILEAKQPNTQVRKLDRKIPIEKIQHIGQDLKNKYPDAAFKFTKGESDNENIVITIEHIERDHSQTPLRQKTYKTEKIEISGDVISRTSNEYSKSIEYTLIDLIEKECGYEIKAKDIDLSSFSSKYVNRFFVELPRYIKELGFSHVISVKVKKNNIDSYDDDEMTREIESKLSGHITAASLSGENILGSPQVKSFLEGDEYYIHLLKWETESVSVSDTNGAKLVIEIKVTPPETRTDFSFDITGYYPKNKQNFKFVKNIQKMEGFKKRPFMKIIRDSAFDFYEELKNEISMV